MRNVSPLPFLWKMDLTGPQPRFFGGMAMLNFTIKQLRYVEAAGRLGSIARAAEELNISQSSITAAIGALEQSLDYDIFVRTPARGIRPTPSGLEALQHIRDFIEQSRTFESEVHSVGGDATGLVRIGCYATAAPSFLPTVLKAITEEFPGISIQFYEGNMARVMEFLEDGLADLTFTYEIAMEARHDFIPLFQAPPYALISREDPASKLKQISLKELSKRPMVMLDLPMAHEYFVGMFKKRGILPNIAHTSRSSEICRALVGSGFGYSILNILPPGYDPATSPFLAVPITGAEAPVFGIATLRGVRQPRTVQAFLDICFRLRDIGAFNGIVLDVTPS